MMPISTRSGTVYILGQCALRATLLHRLFKRSTCSVIGFENMGPLMALDDTKLVLNEHALMLLVGGQF